MSVNRYKPHIFVLPEDDANRQLANGFMLDPTISNQVRILEEAGGWCSVLDTFIGSHTQAMDTFPSRFLVLLIDFDRDPNRLREVKLKVPDNLRERVFVLGVWSEPEEIKKALDLSYEEIGLGLAKDCREGSSETWKHELLSNNLEELERIKKSVLPLPFRDPTK